MGNMFGTLTLPFRAMSALRHARDVALPGLDFDAYGRALAWRELLGSGRIFRFIPAVLNPVSCVRYFEFSFARRVLEEHFGRHAGGVSMLDVSSPRLFPFWMAECVGYDVTMVNPDPPDLARSQKMVRSARVSGNLKFGREGDATSLPYPDNAFDCVSCISVIEHINGDGDSDAISEFVRVVRSGGVLVLSFPVKPSLENEFRDAPCYETQQRDASGKGYFFQRYYDEESIRERLLSVTGVSELERCYYVEEPPGWFQEYEAGWIREGLLQTVRDPAYMADHFRNGGQTHPTDRAGVVCLFCRVE